MQLKIVVVLVLGTQEHLEFGPILQNWPFPLHLIFSPVYTVKIEIGQNFPEWCKTLDSKANSKKMGNFGSDIGYFIPPKVPFLNGQIIWAILEPAHLFPTLMSMLLTWCPTLSDSNHFDAQSSPSPSFPTLGADCSDPWEIWWCCWWWW